MPKYHLTQLVQALNKEELRNFKLYSARLQHEHKTNKTVELLDEIKYQNKDEFSDELVQSFFAAENKNAFYRLKNRLMNDIENSLLLIHREKDIKFEIYKLIELGNIFRYKSKYELAFYYLQKAEKVARSSAGYSDMLNVVYDEIISLANDYYQINPEIYIQKKQKNIEENLDATQATYLIASINYQLKSSNFSFKEKNISQKLDQLIKNLSINPHIADSQQVQFQIHEALRTNLLQKKDFVQLETYLLESLHKFEKLKYFADKYYEKKFIILNWLINVQAINLKFAESLRYTEIFHEELQKNNRKFYDKYLWVYHQSLILNYSFLNRNREVIELLTDIKDNPKLNGHSFYDVLIYLNLSIAYFNENKISQAMKHLLPLLMPEVYSKLSRNLILNISIVEIILHIENEDLLYLESKIKELKRNFRSEFKTTQYAREKDFIDLLQHIVFTPQAFKSKKLRQKISAFIEESPVFEPGSNEAINYKLWLVSKMEKKAYYRLILEAVRVV
ncbi:MAG: hypothetical protein R2798_12435 [Chitinophagales bacterium]|nr:hypothetical protein [Bacteroidota bacterium]MCB9043056.1 hypothetical protein [Chitinophagales bacterium]